MATATIRISDVRVDPLLRDRRRRWLVTAEVLTLHEGELATPVLTVLVHSPSLEFRDPEPVGHVYRVGLADHPDQPYTGRFTAERVAPVDPT